MPSKKAKARAQAKAQAKTEAEDSDLPLLRQQCEEWIAETDGVSHDGLVAPGNPRPYLTDACIARCLRGNEGNVKDGFKQLCKTMEWRCKNKPWTPCPLCSVNPMAHSIRVVGTASSGQPIVYTVFSQSHDRKDVEVGMKHLVCVLEHCADILAIEAESQIAAFRDAKPPSPSGSSSSNSSSSSADGEAANQQLRGPQEKWIWIVDYEGFGFGDCNPKAMTQASNLLAHYPERLDTVMMVDAPWAFWGLWKMVTPFLKEKTKNKLKMVSSSKLEKEAGELLGEEMTAWLLCEIKENKKNPTKEWWEHRTLDGSLKPHDPRGGASFVTSKTFRYNHIKPEQIKSLAFEADSPKTHARVDSAAGTTISKVVDL